MDSGLRPDRPTIARRGSPTLSAPPLMRFAHFAFDPLRDLLGEGRLSEVYRAVDETLDRTVALKILRAEWRSIPRRRTLRARGEAHLEADAPQHRDDLRVRVRRRALHRRGVPQRRTLDKIIQDGQLGWEEGRASRSS